MLKKLAEFAVKKKLILTIIFGVLVVAFAVCIFFVNVNYDSTVYLPDDSPTKMGLDTMYEEFGAGGNVSLMIENITFSEAVAFKNKLMEIDGIAKVIWLDDILSTVDGLTVNDENIGWMRYAVMLIAPEAAGFINQFYTENSNGELCALFQIIFSENDYSKRTFSAIDTILDTGKNLNVHLSGQSYTSYNSAKLTERETSVAMLVTGVIVILILFLMTSSWWEPIIYLVTIGIAVVINMGSNIFLGQISYMSQGVASILQLALTMDYSIFLLNRFKHEKQNGLDAPEAMSMALKKSFAPICASSLTTIASFVALMFMRYTMGLDLGLVLGKSVIASMLCVFFFMPAFTLFTHKLVDRGEHRTFNLHFRRMSKGLRRSRYIIPVLLLCIIAVAGYFQNQNTFLYGNEASMSSEGSRLMVDKTAIDSTFGTQNQVVVLLKEEDFENELELCNELNALPYVSSVQSYATIEATGMVEQLPEFMIKQFVGNSGKYHRVIMNINLPEEGEATFNACREINSVTDNRLQAPYNILGASPSAVEIKELVDFDYTLITIIAIILVAVIIAFTFKSLFLPVILIAVIQGSIWINMSIPYFMNNPIIFIGYMIVSAILLGATIDYGILITNHYVENRATMNKTQSMQQALAMGSKAVLTSAGILCLGGFAISFVSSMPAVATFGLLVGQGALCSLLLVLILLPQLLILLDTPIRLTMLHGKELMMPANDIPWRIVRKAKKQDYREIRKKNKSKA